MSFTANDLLFHYKSERRRAVRPALDLGGYELRLPTEGTVALLGESGSGKSTLLNVLGLLWDRRPSRGTVRLGDDPRRLHELAGAEQARLRRETFGFVFQSSYLLPHFSVRQNVAVPLELAGVAPAEQRRRIDALLDAAGLAPLAEKAARTLSGGERQRAAALRAIVHDPQYVFADEPTSNLDRQHARAVLDLLARWRTGSLDYQDARHRRVLFLISHNLREVRRVEADHLLLIFDGQVVGRRVYPGTLGDEAIYDAIERGIVPTADPVAVDDTGDLDS